MDEAVPALATGQASTDGVTEQPVNVYIWDMDETLILLKSLLDGSYAGAFDGLKDHEKSTEIGKRWENLILELCDEHFFYEEIENYNEPYLNALNEYDDGRDLTSYDFEADCFSSPYDDANKKKLAYRHRAIGEKYAKGLEKVLDGHMVKVCNDQYSLTDKYTDGWLSSANRIVPPHEGIELGIRDASVIRALAEAYGRKEEHVKKDLKELGDLGLVAKASRSSQKMMFKPKPLTIARVLSTFRTIAKESGKDSQDKKRNHMKGLLVAATDCEPQYITRLLQSKMRIGLAEKTVQMALGQAAVFADKNPLPPKVQSPFEEAAKIIKQAYSVLPIYDKIVPAILEVGVWKLPETCKFSIGVPVGPMLAKATKSVSEIIDKFQGLEYTCEYKYDGERAQIHCMEDGSVEIYSRNAERNTGKYPDVVDAVSRFRKATVKSFVLDCEIVAYDREKQKILPFQILSTRARKGVTINDIKVSVCTFGFDILYINGKPLLQEQLKIRREHLYNSFEEVPGVFKLATAITSNDLEEIQKFLDTAVNSSCEGLIIKTLDKDATYEPAKRSNNWLKLKKDYMDSIGDSLDLVPIAAFYGRGKRTGVFGSFLLACYDEQNEEYQTICNIGTGFSEQQLEERSASLRSKVIEKPKAYYRFGDTMNPDVWFEPSEVWEVKAADLSISPVHRAANGIVDPNKGISLRFPRLLRLRDDKSPEQATTSDQVADMYRSQKINHGYNQEDEDDD